MDGSTSIYSKTARGLAMLRNGSRDVNRENVKILATVDGTSTIDELITKLSPVPAPKIREGLDWLEKAGLIKILAATFASNKTNQSDTTQVSGDSIEFTSAGPVAAEIEVLELSPQDSVQAWAEAHRGSVALQQNGFYTHSKTKAFPRISLEGLSIMIVDDDENVSNLMATMLVSKEVKVRQCWDIAEASKALENEALPDMVLLDVVLPGAPGQDGFDLLAMIRQNSKSASLPVIMVTSQIGGEDIMRGLKARADGYIFKPLKWSILYKCIRTVFGLPVE